MLLTHLGALRYNPSTGTLLVPNLNVAGTTTTVDTVTMEASNAVIFEGATADSNETTLSIVDPTADHTQYLINQGGYIPLLAAATTTAITSTPAELNLLDGSSANTVVNSKAVIYGSSGELAGTLSTAAQSNVTSLGTLTALTVDNVVINGATIGHGDDTDLMTVADGVLTVAGELDAATLDISGNADIDGTLEADAITVDGTTLAEYIADTAGAMVSSNTETGIAVTYQDGDNTIDFAIDAAQTAITSIYNTSLAIGYGSSHANIDFGTDNRIVFDIDGTSQVILLDGVFRPTTDSDVDLGASAKYFKDAYIDTITTTGLVTAGGRLITDDATEATSTTDGSLQTDGGLSVAKDVVAGDDVKLLSDAAVLSFGADSDVTITHVADTGLLLNSTMQLQFNDASQNINAPSATVLDINATDEIELNATLADVNANLDVSGTYTGGGLMTTGGNIVIPNAGNIGSASDTDAIAIASNGVVTFSQVPLLPNDTVATADIQADAITGAKIADNAIDSEHYTDGSIDTAHIADDQITLAKMASGTDGNIISYDASGNPVAIATGNDGQVLTSTGAGSPPAFETLPASGKMLQVVSATWTTSTQTSSTSYVDVTDGTATITPAATSSKVLILVSLGVFTDSDNSAVGEFKIVRTISGSASDVSNSVFSQVSFLAKQMGNHFLMVLDSPSTTSAATYKLQFFRTDQSGFVEVNRNDGSDIQRSVITLIEVGA